MLAVIHQHHHRGSITYPPLNDIHVSWHCLDSINVPLVLALPRLLGVNNFLGVAFIIGISFEMLYYNIYELR
jgi:hypothetical protein